MQIYKEHANAKINLFLDVVSLREDGFHDIKSIMHCITLSDVITVRYAPSKKTSIKLTVGGGNHLPTDGKNLAYKAAELYLERVGKSADISIHIEKNIPIAAGLAGGSADAAAVLRIMNRIFSRMFSERAMYAMAGELGSDIPFCYYGRTALCEGRGEKMQKLKNALEIHTVVAVANEYMSTPAAYKKLDELYSSFDGSVRSPGVDKLNSIYSDIVDLRKSVSSGFNIFEDAVFPLCKNAEKLKEKMIELGADFAMMSGSGPSVFGVFKNRAIAERAEKALKNEGVTAFYATSAK